MARKKKKEETKTGLGTKRRPRVLHAGQGGQGGGPHSASKKREGRVKEKGKWLLGL